MQIVKEPLREGNLASLPKFMFSLERAKLKLVLHLVMDMASPDGIYLDLASTMEIPTGESGISHKTLNIILRCDSVNAMEKM